jgi:hypothetical protein
MKAPSPRKRRTASRFMAWLAVNPSGVPRGRAIRLALIGVMLGVGAGLLMRELGGAQTTPLPAGGLALLLGSVAGAILAPLGVVLIAQLLDRAVLRSDPLIGYGGLIRMLLHAGELSFLGALAGGIGAGAGTPLRGLVVGVVMTGLVGAVLYRVRGLGLLLGLTIGIITGAIGGALGGIIHSFAAF